MHQQALCKAIRRQTIVKLSLLGDFHYRLFEPHIVYTTSQGDMCVEGRDIGGAQSGRYAPPKWESFFVDDITALDFTTTAFQPEPGFNPESYSGDITCCVPQVVHSTL